MKREVSPGPLGVGGGGELQLLHCPRATWYILVLCPPQSGGGMVSSRSLLYPVTRWIVVKIAFARAAPPPCPLWYPHAGAQCGGGGEVNAVLVGLPLIYGGRCTHTWKQEGRRDRG